MKTLPLQTIVGLPSSATNLRSHYEAAAFGLVEALWRRKLLILAIMTGAVAMAFATIPLLERRYTADALIQLDLTQSRSTAGAAAPTIALDPVAVVESEARIIRSRTIARRVVTELNLVDDPAFAPRPSRSDAIGKSIRSLAEGLPLAWLPAFEPPADETADVNAAAPLMDLVVLEVMKGLEVRNDTRSYLISIVYTARSPQIAARLANAFAEAYLKSRIEASFASASRTSAWLGEQMAEGRSALDAADHAVQRFRETTGFLEPGADGVSVQEQQLIEVNTQLSAATVARADQVARLQRIRDMLAAGHIPSVSDLAGSPVIQGLLESEVAAKREVARVSTLGFKHPMLAATQSALDEVQTRLKEELEKAVAIVENDVVAATAAEQALNTRAEELQHSTIEAKARGQELRNLQGYADNLRDRLKILTESQEQANALAELKPVTAELVMPAESVGIPSEPKPKIIIALTLFVALTGSVCAVFLLERRDTGFRTDVDAARELEVPCMGMIPRLRRSARRSERLAFHEAARAIIAGGVGAKAREASLVLVTSALPQEGKTVLAYALAGCLVSSGRSVLILNAGSRERIRAPASARVLLNLEEVLSQEDKSGSLLAAQARDQPVVIQCDRALQGFEDLFTSPAFEGMLDHAKSLYDVVIVEVPAVMLFADALVLGRHADFVLHVIRWNRTPKRTVEAALRKLHGAALRVGGTVLTQVDSREHRKYSIRDEMYYRRKYAKRFDRLADLSHIEKG